MPARIAVIQKPPVLLDRDGTITKAIEAIDEAAGAGAYWLGGVAVVTVLMLVARPATVFLCAWPDRRARWSFAEMLFMCWTRETGVIPAALAGLLLGMKAPGAQMIASVTFIAILMTILIQAPTTEWLGRRLGLLEKG
jgi:cell volume regulation protein A